VGLLVQALMWMVLVEMLGVAVQDHTGVLFVADQQVVCALAADATDEPFGVAVRAGRPRRDLDHIDAYGGEDRVERGGERGVDPNARSKPPVSPPRDGWPTTNAAIVGIGKIAIYRTVAKTDFAARVSAGRAAADRRRDTHLVVVPAGGARVASVTTVNDDVHRRGATQARSDRSSDDEPKARPNSRC
jgi:hypothetical protein